MSNRPSLDDYIDVAERIQNFKDIHPEGTLQTVGWEIVQVEGIDKAGKQAGQTFIVYRAAAFRHADDLKPGHGTAWEPFPGRTPYTKDSELMNAETAAWGRAICALGLVTNRSLASRQEVRNRRADQDAENAPPKSDPAESPEPPEVKTSLLDGAVLSQLRELYLASGVSEDKFVWQLLSVGVESLPENPTREDIGNAMRGLTLEQALKLEALLKGEDEAVPGSGESK